MLKFKHILSKNIFYLLLSVLLLFSALPAGAKTGETEQKIQDEAPVLKGSIETEKKERKYIYNPVGKTDPFKSFIIEIKEKKEKEDEDPRTYLETLELSQLSLSIVIVGDKGKWALVQDAKGDGHVIKEGTPIGLNRGTVYKILPGEVIIREPYKNALTGETEFRDVSKKTPSDK
jgi:type IV pilus assembly protein PilP